MAETCPSVANVDFYPRSPCGERPCHQPLPSCPWNFYPRSPCGERRAAIDRHARRAGISIHALLAESDTEAAHQAANGLAFLSTLSLRRATPYFRRYIRSDRTFLSTLSLRRATGKSTTLTRIAWISIHALLAESDFPLCQLNLQRLYFYPRSPCGERQSRRGRPGWCS